jgi:O-antigen/teichoic acid export membrane protein
MSWLSRWSQHDRSRSLEGGGAKAGALIPRAGPPPTGREARPDTRPAFRRLLANTGLLLGGRAVTVVLNLSYLALAARTLGPQPFGVLVLINAFAQLLGEVVKFQSWQTVLQYGAGPLIEGRRGDLQRVVRFTLILDLAGSAAGVIIGVVVSLTLGDLLGWPEGVGGAAAVYALSVAFMVSATPLGLLRLFNRFDILAGHSAVVSLVRLAGCAWAFLAHASMGPLLGIWAAGTVAGFIYLGVAAWLQLRNRGLLEGFSWRGPLTAGMPGAWPFALATNVNATLDVAFTHAVTLVVGTTLGPAQAGYWRVGRAVAGALAKPARLLIPPLYPELARLRVANREGAMTRLALQVGALGGGAGLALLAVTALAGKPLVVLVLGAAFAPAAKLMIWQVTAAAIGVLAQPLEPMLVTLRRPVAVLKVRAVVSVLFLAAIGPLVSHFGGQGAGAALVAASAAMGLGMLWMFLRDRSSRPPGCEAGAWESPPGAVRGET